MSIKLVIADDAPFIREIVSQMASADGFEVVGEAANGREAIDLAIRLRPDVILMDIVMPLLSGLEAAKKILEEWPEARIVACSTVDSESIMLKAIEAGCQDYVLKPFERGRLISALKGPSPLTGGKQ